MGGCSNAHSEDQPETARSIVFSNQSTAKDMPFNFQFAANTFDDVDIGKVLTCTTMLDDTSPLPGWLTFNAGRVLFQVQHS